MEEQLVSFETAKLAKEKGFKINKNSTISIQWTQDCDSKSRIPYEPYCFLNGNYFKKYNYCKDKFKKIFADKTKYSIEVQIPTQSLLQKWLREVHDIHLNVEFYPDRKEKRYCITGDYKTLNRWTWLDHEHDIYFEIFEDALELGLQEALKLII